MSVTVSDSFSKVCLRPSFRLSTLLLALVALVACAKSDDAWQQAMQTDTPDAYERFLERNPGSPRAAEARIRRDALIDERDWLVARRSNSVDAFDKYIAAHGEGAWVELATRRRNAIAGSESPDKSLAGSSPASSATESLGLTPPPAALAAVTTPNPPQYIQLGAFSSAVAAKKSWERLQRSFVELQPFEPTIDESPVRGSSLYRLRVGVDSREHAELVCSALVRGGAACILPAAR